MRKLATAALAFSAAAFAANYILPLGWLIVPAVLLAVGGAALMALRRKWLRGLIIAMLFFSLGLLNYYVHYQLTAGRAEKLAGETLQVRVRLLSYPVTYGDYCRAEGRMISPDLPRLKAIVYDNSASIGQARPGDTLSFQCRLNTADTLYGQKYGHYYAKGIYLKLSSKGELSLEHRELDPLSLPAYASRFLSQRIESVFPEDTAHFMRSLMLGDKSGLYNDEALHLALTRAGFMHIVAVSGMHIAFLVGLIRLLFGASGRSSIICIILIWCFTLITGAGPATVRAAFMQTLLLLSSVLYRENDPVTSLSAVLALILLCNPFAAASVSLQLSFGAMAGILCFTGRRYEALAKLFSRRKRCRALDYALATVSSSLGVMVFVLPLTALHFGYVSLLSVLTNMAGLWAVSLCFCGGWIACLLSVAPALGTAAGWLCSWLARYIFLVSGLVSRLPYSVLYMQTRGAWLWLLVTYLALLTAALVKGRTWLRIALPCLLSLSMLWGVLILARREYRDGKDTLAVIDVGQGQSIAAFSGDGTAVIDCGNSFSLDNAGELTGAYLMSCGRRRIDLLVLTHLHADHANGVSMLMELMDVGTLILPDGTEDPDGLLDGILKAARQRGTELVRLRKDSQVNCGDIELRLFAPTGAGEENERCISALLSLDGFDALITADGSAQAEQALAKDQDLSGTELLVVGHHGSKYSSSAAFLEKLAGDYAVISTGYNTYGHPAEETLERLREHGYNILRTDLDGTVEIRVG